MQYQNTLLHETEPIIVVIENYLLSGVYMGVDKQKFLGRQCSAPLPRMATENYTHRNAITISPHMSHLTQLHMFPSHSALCLV